MAIGCREYQRLSGQSRVDMFRELAGDNLVEGLCDHTAIERVDIVVDFVGRANKIDLASARVENFHLLALFEADASARQFRFDANGRLMIDKIAVDDRLPIGIGEDRVAEDLHGMKGRGGGQTDLDRVKML